MNAICKRCGKPFKPELFLGKPQTCCYPCMFRNLSDGLDMPTPPALLDKFTKHPTLSDAEYQKKLNDANENTATP